MEHVYLYLCKVFICLYGALLFAFMGHFICTNDKLNLQSTECHVSDPEVIQYTVYSRQYTVYTVSNSTYTGYM